MPGWPRVGRHVSLRPEVPLALDEEELGVDRGEPAFGLDDDRAPRDSSCSFTTLPEVIDDTHSTDQN